jgi:peptide/nickel transport system substrate-binding protein
MRSPRRDHDDPITRRTAARQMRRKVTRRKVLSLAALGVLAAGTKPARAADGQLVYGAHISLAPTWFDPAETPGIVTPFMLLYALHDGLVKPMPNNPAEPCLAESYTASADAMSHTFVLRAGAKFHNGEPVTAEDVKFSFERYRGNAAGFIKEHVAEVETPDPRRVVFRLNKPWPDFLLYYSSVTGAGWIVPKKYVESVGEDGFKKAPVGAGPYKFVSFTPGVELVMEAFDGYWRKAPTVKRLVWKVIPDEATRLAALKRGEIDIAYSIRGELAEELKKTPGLQLKPVVINSPFWIYFADQWDPKSPWSKPQVRKAVTLALDREGINQALTLGYSLITGSIVPKDYEGYWQPPKIPYDPAAARKLLAEAGFAKGFDGGEYFCDASYANLGEAAMNSLEEIGIKMKLRPMERAAFTKEYGEKKYRNLIQGGSGAFGNAATRMETFVVKGGTYVYGSYPDIDELFGQVAQTDDKAKRTELLHRMQQLVHERTVYAPLWQLAFLNGQGPRVGEAAFNMISGHPYSAPYEEVRLKNGTEAGRTR